MKPRTKREKSVDELRHTLKTRKSDIDWIYKRHTLGKSEYFCVYEKVGIWQVVRFFMIKSYSKKREYLHEPMRYWFHPCGYSLMECKNRQCLGNCYVDAWCINSDLELRPCNGNRDPRIIVPNYSKVHSLIPELERTSFNARKTWDLRPFYLVKSLLSNSRVETLYKLNQKVLTWKFYFFDVLTDDLWQSIRVALKHGYHWDSPNEINDWCDMIRDLHYLNLDTRSPHYICPSNLSEAHTHWNDVVTRIKRKIHLQEEIRKVAEYEPTFFKNRERFLDMEFVDGEIHIAIIPTAAAIKEEGVAMHHCVGGYYNKVDSLILSAKIDGKRIETIEVNLTSYELVQSRGACNKSTPYHDRIVNLINNNMGEIIRRNNKIKIAV